MRARIIAVGAMLVLVAAAGVLILQLTGSRGSAESRVTVRTGGRIELAGASLVVPPGAVGRDSRVSASTNGPPVDKGLVAVDQPASMALNVAPIGKPVLFSLTEPLSRSARVTVRVDASALPRNAPIATDPRVVWLAFYDTRIGQWMPVDSRYNPKDRTISATVSHLSWWQAWTWNWSEVQTRVDEMVRTLVTPRRASLRQCPADPGGIRAISTPTGDPPLVGCGGSGPDVALVELTNNRPYGMMLFAPSEARLSKLPYKGFMDWVRSTDLVTQVLGAPYLSPDLTATYQLAPSGQGVRFESKNSWRTLAFDLAEPAAKIAVSSLPGTREIKAIREFLSYSDCILDTVAHSEPPALRDAPNLVFKCLPALVKSFPPIQVLVSSLQATFILSDAAVDAFEAADGEVTVNRPTDRRNTTYTTDCGFRAPPASVRLRSGVGRLNSAFGYENVELHLEAMATGDLTRDGRPETAALLFCSPLESAYWDTEVQVFDAESKLLARLRPPSQTSPYSFSPQFGPQQDSYPPRLPSSTPFVIRGQRLVTGVTYWTADDAHCCPSIRRTITWRWDGRQLIAEAP